MADELTFSSLAAEGASSLSSRLQARRARNQVDLNEETAVAPTTSLEQAQLNFAAMQLEQKMEIINFLTLLMGRPSRLTMARTD